MKTIYRPTYEKIMQKIKEARKDSGLRQEQVAEALSKYQSYLSKIENGDRRVDIIELMELAQLYDKDLNFFVADAEKVNVVIPNLKPRKKRGRKPKKK